MPEEKSRKQKRNWMREWRSMEHRERERDKKRESESGGGDKKTCTTQGRLYPTLSVPLTQTSQETPNSLPIHSLSLTAAHLLQHALPSCLTMWRMNSMALVLVLCTLLLRNGVVGQDDDTVTDAPAGDAANEVTPTVIVLDSQQDTTNAPDSGASPGAGGDSDTPSEMTTPSVTGSPNHNQDGDTAGTTAGPNGLGDDGSVIVDHSNTVKTKPLVECVGKEEIEESNAVKAVVTTTNCEDTKTLIQGSRFLWCHTENCRIKVYQEGNNIRMVRDDAKQHTLADALKGELKDKLGVANVEAPSSSSSSNRSVFVGILITGLLVAAAIVAAYCKCQRRTDSKGVKLAEEAYPVDQENQGNTLVSVAPLNPPAETQEKPNVNGESPEAAKTEPTPPTNGHSATKTADTEL
uniref:uncharacterized protein cd34 n=1 Tax=Doryrhamphus excisus TaxID=161450 RepID=UPI0025ADE0E2|nr:uncharacterized protein cd34 [Doryrhamphus excisus]